MRSPARLAPAFAVLAALACATPEAAPPAAQPDSHLAVTRTRTQAPSFGETKFEAQLAAAQEAVEGGRYDEADGILDPIVAEYRALPREGVVYTVGGVDETVLALMAAAAAAEGGGGADPPADIAALPLDPGFPRAFGLRAFVQVERREYEAALETLTEQERMVRIDPGPTNERGFVLLTLKRPAEALEAYRDGLEKARRFERSEKIQAISLRGMGVALIDLDRLDEAKTALLDSLSLDPGNHVANNELRYIERLEAGKR